MPPFRLLDHTADIAIEATGRTQGATLSEAGIGLSAVLTGRDGRQPWRAEVPMRFRIEAPELPSLTVAFLSELLWLMESKDLLWLGGGVDVAHADDGMWSAQADGNGLVYDPVRHGQGVEVKAVTYSDLAFERTRAGWRLRVLLDI